MKKAFLLLFCGVLVAACQKDPVPPVADDSELEGQEVSMDGVSVSAKKIFVLNEGGMGSNNATLDFLRMENGNYVASAFKRMNSSEEGGLGDVGNDIAVKGDEVWIVVNNSGIVEVVSAKNEKEIAAITVPTPRNIAFDDDYAYVTSWSGAFASGAYDSSGNYTITASQNNKGHVYRIDLKTKKVKGTVEVGLQPEGIACYGGKLYVANSGGISSQLGQAYDNTVSVIDTKNFTVSKTIDVQINLKNVFSDGKGNIYVTTLGNYFDVHSGIYMIDSNDRVSKISDYVSVASILGDTVYWIGAEEELDWAAAKTWKGAKCKAGTKSAWNIALEETTPYGLCVLDSGSFLVADAGDYYNPGSVSLYTASGKAWIVTAGVCPSHFAIW